MTPQQVMQLIRRKIDNHDPEGGVQWYIDQFCIDCDAGEFWQVVEQALTEVDNPRDTNPDAALLTGSSPGKRPCGDTAHDDGPGSHPFR